MSTSAVQEFEKELTILMERFERQFSQYTSADYAAASVRQEFLNPLLRVPGRARIFDSLSCPT